jgi:predicted GTPase
VDNVPRTDCITHYEWKRPDAPVLKLLDTPGYGGEAAFATAFQAAQEADLVLLGVHARSAARKADAEFLKALSEAFAAKPNLRAPEIIVVATHIDLLTPAAEWSPPYDFAHGVRPKEATTREALAAIAEDLGPLPMVPVCVMAGRVWNVAEALVPAMAAKLDSARGVGALRAFHASDSGQDWRRTLEQTLALGRETLKVLWNATAPR